MKIRSVIFDFGGVLCLHPTTAQVTQAARACGVQVETFLDAFWSHRVPYDAGDFSPDDYWKAVAKTLGHTFDDNLIAEMVEREIDFWSHFDQRMLDWTMMLRANGLRTGILSNLPLPLGRHLRALPGFLDHFDHVSFSSELRTSKPEPAIYEHAIRGAGVKPAEILFLDDRRENVHGALEAGMRSELYVDWPGFIEDILGHYELPNPAATGFEQPSK